MVAPSPRAFLACLARPGPSPYLNSGEDDMARFLIIAGVILVLAGLAWPFIAKLGLGRLPGDIVFHRGNTTFYFPIMTSIILSIVLSAVLWLLGR
jgi:hypothetical protein